MKITDTERMNAVIGGLIFWQLKYKRGWGAHWGNKYGYESGADKGANTYFGTCAREVIDAAMRNRPVRHCSCCNVQKKGKP